MMFRTIGNNIHKAKAAVVVQNLLEHYQQNSIGGFADRDAASTATVLVQHAFDIHPDVFSGKFGKRPHKLSFAATAISLGAEMASKQENFQHFVAYNTALTNLLNEADVNGAFHGLTNADIELFERAMDRSMTSGRTSFGNILEQATPIEKDCSSDEVVESEDEVDWDISPVIEVLSEMDLQLTEAGIPEAMVAIGSNYTPAEVSSFLYLHMLARLVHLRDAPQLDEHLIAYKVLTILKEHKDQGRMDEKIWTDDTNYISYFIFKVPYTDDHFALAKKIVQNTACGDGPFVERTLDAATCG